jgi:outer membrane protein OmpA-like peptidoglycan-associated protein
VPAPAPIEANIAAAQSGSVPSSALTSPPLGGPMQVAVIQFGRNSAGLSADDVEVLARVAQIQRRNGGTVRVLGHALKDAVGSSPAEIKNGNLNLSIKRAEAVAKFLIRNGVPSNAIVMEGVSDEEPVYETRTARGIAANRRAEVFIDF